MNPNETLVALILIIEDDDILKNPQTVWNDITGYSLKPYYMQMMRNSRLL